MKKLICLLTVAILCCTAGIAETIDLSAMTTEELTELRLRIDEELMNRTTPAAGDVIRDDEYCLLILKDYTFHGMSNGIVRLTLNCEWTNRRDKTETLGDWVTVRVDADGRTPKFSREGFGTIIRAKATAEAQVIIDVPDWADSVEVKFQSFWKPSDVYKTYTFHVVR
ncbi:MAG: hypothetical protein IKP10_00725 [Clostridia bacterium]|nr:hypothetical protein [Clostridia bacterium]